jgi:DNA-binding CsgD family transcriptional regulator
MIAYCAIIGDINRSRDLPHRARVQRAFQRAIEHINTEFRDEIASDFVLTIGDEFQGLLRSAKKGYRLVRRFAELMEPVDFAFGMGIGPLSTPLRKEAALGMDGEAFHRARAALVTAKKEKRSLVLDFDHPSLPLANALLALMERDWARLTPRQKEIIHLVAKYGNQSVVARKLGISQPAVSKSVSSSLADRLAEAEEALGGFLSSVIP